MASATDRLATYLRETLRDRLSDDEGERDFRAQIASDPALRAAAEAQLAALQAILTARPGESMMRARTAGALRRVLPV